MYLPPPFEERDLSHLHDLVEAHPFGLLVVARPDGSQELAHVPFVLERDRGPRGLLRFHVARANPAWRLLDGEREGVAVFTGPHGYVSPRWYASREDVPTWSYAVVHARGVPRVVTDAAAVRDLLRKLAKVNEAGAPDPWTLDDLPPALYAELVEGIVALDMPIDALEGKWKLGQNRSRSDREGVVRALRERGSDGDEALARLIDETLRG